MGGRERGLNMDEERLERNLGLLVEDLCLPSEEAKGEG